MSDKQNLHGSSESAPGQATGTPEALGGVGGRMHPSFPPRQMMMCSDELLQLYVEGDLEPVESAIIDEHLKGCAACRRRAGLYKGLFWDLTHPPQTEADVGPADELAALLRAEWQRGQPASQRAGANPLALSTLWLTANPAVRAVGGASMAGLNSLGQAGRAGLSRLFRRKGGDRR